MRSGSIASPIESKINSAFMLFSVWPLKLKAIEWWRRICLMKATGLGKKNARPSFERLIARSRGSRPTKVICVVESRPACPGMVVAGVM